MRNWQWFQGNADLEKQVYVSKDNKLYRFLGKNGPLIDLISMSFEISCYHASGSSLYIICLLVYSTLSINLISINLI